MQRRNWYLLTHLPVAGWFLALAVVVIAHRFLPAAAWSMVHLLLLGAASTLILIWSQHFADTILRRPAPGGRPALVARIAGHTLGAVAVVAGVASGAWALTATGAAIVAAVAVSHGVILFAQSRRALPSRFRPLVAYYLAACAALVLGVGAGVWMARADLAAGLHDRLYVAHVVLNVLGWIGLTAVGTLLLLWPTVLHARIREATDVLARRALPTLAVGVLVAAGGAMAAAPLGIALGCLLYLAGLVAVAVEAVGQARRAQPGGFAAWSLACALAWFAFSVAGVGAVAAVDPGSTPMALTALLPALVAGFGAQLLLGALSYLLPVVLGGGPAAARESARELDRAGLFRVLAANGGIVIYLLPVPSLVRVLLSLMVFLVLAAFLVLAVRAVVVSRRLAGVSARPSEPGEPRARRSLTGLASAAVAVLVLTVAVGVALDPASAGIDRGSVASVRPTGETTRVDVTMKNMRFTPATVRVPLGDRLVISLRNDDDMVHDLTLDNGVKSKRLGPGESQTLDVGIVSRTLDGWCSIAGHRQLGMVMAIEAVGGAATPEAGPHHGAAGSGTSAAADVDLAREPSASFVARDPVLPPAPSATVHRQTFTVTDVRTEVAPGVTQTLWTFGGTAPGPTLRGRVGDVFEITLVNDADMGHSIDFHAGELAPDTPMRTIQPGESLVYRFTATHSGIWLYHCATMPMSQHIANGMFGAVIIDPPGLDPVDREFVLVQSGFYLGPQADVADPARVATERPDLVAFNGYADQYRYRPIPARAGERVRIWVLDAGPNTASAFHVVGTQFDTVYKEGDYRLRRGGSTATGASQVLDLAAAQGGFVEFTFPEPGRYPFLSHVMSDAEKGASGVFAVSG